MSEELAGLDRIAEPFRTPVRQYAGLVREIAGDKQIIHVSGIIRPSDITFANTVGSGKVADFHVVYKGKGQEGRFTKPGWLGRFLNVINPF